MGVRCLVCRHYSDINKCKYFRFPPDEFNLNVWKRFFNLSDDLFKIKNPRVCSCHFKDNRKPELLDDSDLQLSALFCNVDESRTPNISTISESEWVSDEMNEAFYVSEDPAADNSVNEDLNVRNIDESGFSTYELNEASYVSEDDAPDNSVSYENVNNAQRDIQCKEHHAENEELKLNIQESRAENIDFKKIIQEHRAEKDELEKNIREYCAEIDELKKNIREHQSEKDNLKKKIEEHQAENKELKKENLENEKQLATISFRFSMKFIEYSDELVYLHTGLPNTQIFDVVFNTISKVKFSYFYNWKVDTISKREHFLMTLMKLKMNLRHYDLAQRFECSQTTVSNVFRTFMLVMHELLYKKLMSKIPSRQKNKKCLPSVFAALSARRVIFDTSEIMSDKPIMMLLQRHTFSPYQHYNTWKGLFGVAPNGVITYASDLYPGSTSDKKIVEHCGVTDQLIPGDLVIADKGFLIDDLLPYGVNLNVPPFLTTPQFTESQVHETKHIARARVHVERGINKTKNVHILDHISSINE